MILTAAFLLAAAARAATGFDVASDGKVLHRLDGEKDGKGAAVWYSRSTDGGATWGPRARVDAASRPAYRFAAGDARVVSDGRTVLVVWTAAGDGPMGSGPLAAARSADGGRTWSEVPSPSPKGSFGRRFPAVAASGGAFHAVWLDRSSGTKVLASASRDGGASWSAPAVLDADACECCWNALLPARDGVWALFRGKDPRDMAASRLARGRWSRPAAVGPAGWAFNGCPHVGGALAEAGGAVHALSWSGLEASGLGVSRWDGRAWTGFARLGGPGAKHGDLAASGRSLAAVWSEGGAVWASRSDGGPWSPPARVTPDGVEAAHPRVVPSQGGFRVFWLGKDGTVGSAAPPGLGPLPTAARAQRLIGRSSDGS